MTKLTLVKCLPLLHLIPSYCQILIQGKVLDRVDKSPFPYVNIGQQLRSNCLKRNTTLTKKRLIMDWDGIPDVTRMATEFGITPVTALRAAVTGYCIQTMA